MLISDAELARAQRLLAGVARVTPVCGFRTVAEQVGGPVWLKCENLQRTGSFKIRGAYVRMARLTEDDRQRGVVAASAGNHAQGVALAAQLLGIPARVYMPEGAPLPKVEATRGYGARVVLTGRSVDEALAAAAADAERTAAVLIHPFDHPDVIAGQGTVGLEILDQVPDVATVVVPTGGGGLVSGIAAAVKAHHPHVRVVAAQAEGAAAWPASLAAGAPVALEGMATMADGIAVGCPGAATFAHVAALVDDVVTVGEEDLSQALLACLERGKLLVEPAGVAALAAVMTTPGRYAPPVVCVLSGGNVDPLLLVRLLRHGLVAAGRYLSLRVAIPDVPGALAGLLEVLAASGANVLDVSHARTQADLHLDEVEVAVQAETRGPAQARAVLAALRRSGYRVATPGRRQPV